MTKCIQKTRAVPSEMTDNQVEQKAERWGVVGPKQGVFFGQEGERSKE
jgi:hypothetical protein